MPAMSPTMTEGNIASWKVKEGDSFTIGDVLLEIETDKAQMDVEAQDDGIMAKIMQPDGSKGVKVGRPIAVLAEPGDDLSSLCILEVDTTSTASPQEKTNSGIDPKKSPESQAETPPSSKADTPPTSSTSSTDSSPKHPSSNSSQLSKQTYPLYPSITQLLHEKGLPISEADKIPASGPKGRLLKGDVLAYLGTIESSYSSNQSARISKLGHLDLSNIKVAPPKEIPAPPPETVKTTLAPPQPNASTEITVSISLKAVREVQQRIQNVLGIGVPLSTFIARAIEISNDELPPPKSSQLTSDELFNQVLGLHKVASKTSRGSFTPQITALPPTPLVSISRKPLRKPDIIDILTNSTTSTSDTRPMQSQGMMGRSGAGATSRVLSVSAPNGQEKRARIFLERMKTILQVEPGRLVI